MNLFSKSKRQNLIYILLVVWVGFGVVGFVHGSNFADLATYFGTFAGPSMVYIWGETKRKHDSGPLTSTDLELDRA